MKLVQKIFLPLFVIALSVAYQVHCAIHGFDLTDEGYLMSIYQWFNTDIHYAQGAGGYPLTGYLGSLLNSIFPEKGILGMRLWGVVLVTLTEIGVFCYLRRYFNPALLLVGLLIQTIAVCQDPKPFGYNTLTAFTALIAIGFLVEGTIRNRHLLLLISGFLLGVNVFVRLPNITGLGFLLIPLVSHFQDTRHWGFRNSIPQVASTLLGFAIGMILTWQFLVSIGASQMVVELVLSITAMLGGNSTHGSGSMLSMYAGNYIMAFWYVVIFAFTTFICAYSLRAKQWWLTLIGLFIAFMIIYQNAYMHADMLGDNIYALINGLGITGACYYLNKEKRLQVMALAGILFSLIIPLGSDCGFLTMWVGAWMLLPISLSGIYHFLCQAAHDNYTIGISLKSGTEQQTTTRGLMSIHAKYVRKGYLFALCFMVVTTFIKVEHKPYYDPGNRSQKTAAILSPMAQGIYTIQQRAEIVNPMLTALSNYVKPGDELLVYDSSPLVYYLTQTRPFAGISWPCVFYGQSYVDKFKAAEKQAPKLPVVVMQYYVSSNKWTEVNPNYYMLKNEGGTDDDSFFSTKEMKLNIRRFLKEHNYKTVWSNKYYDILVCPR